MDQFTRNDLRDLVSDHNTPTLTIYLPTHKAGAEIQQDPIRLKDLVQQAKDSLIQNGLDSVEAQKFLEPIQNELLLDETFWQHQSEGLVIFATPDKLQYYRLPFSFDEVVRVGDQFYVKPLFELFQQEGRFYILALSQDNIRLLEGSKYSVRQVELEDMPTSLAEALKYDDPEKQVQQHEISRGRKEGGPAEPDVAFHGHGVGTDDKKTNLLRYFQKVDNGLQDYLNKEEKVPLVLAGVEYLLPIYREASSYNGITDGVITGNPEGLTDEELHAKAWEIIEPIFKEAEQKAALFYDQQAGMETGRTSDQIEEIVQSAYGGRVAQLFIRKGADIPGHYNRDTNQVHVSQNQTETGEDLINTAAIDTFLNHGSIFVASEEDMPGPSPVAAVFYY